MAVLVRRLCRQSTVAVICVVDFLWLLSTHLLDSRCKKACVLLTCSTVLVWWNLYHTLRTTGTYTEWHPSQTSKPVPPDTRIFRVAVDPKLYMYSAIANYHYPSNGDTNVVLTVMDGSGANFHCCVLMDNRTLFVTPASIYYEYHTFGVAFIAKILEVFSQEYLYAKQFVCIVPSTGHTATHATLTPTSQCPSELRDYVPILYPPRVPGGLALCGKIAHSGGLDPEKLIEWVEIQKFLGVDKILLFDMGNPDELTRVFRYYQAQGILDLQPYELPGKPEGRTLMEKDKHNVQFHHDESLVVLECRQRMAGYSYVMSHDVDEFIIPRKDVTLKEFFKSQMEVYQDSAGFYFDAEFFIYNWGASNPEEDLMVTRYRRATLPHWECTKYVYLPYRVLSSTTHSIEELSPFSTYRLGPELAVLHHYRRCPDDVWATCNPETLVDHVMLRFKEKGLHQRVLAARKATKTITEWAAHS